MKSCELIVYLLMHTLLSIDFRSLECKMILLWILHGDVTSVFRIVHLSRHLNFMLSRHNQYLALLGFKLYRAVSLVGASHVHAYAYTAKVDT